MKIIYVVGTRPQFIKLAPLVTKINEIINKKPKGFKISNHIILNTGQHYDYELSNLIFRDLEINCPTINLNIKGIYHGEQTGKMLIEIEKKLFELKPDLVIVFGDTNSTLAGSLASSKMSIKSIHIEAGLRSFNKSMPEEINRIVSDHVCDYLFAPTKTAIENLKNEGLSLKSFLTVDIMVDSIKLAINKTKNLSKILSDLNIKPNEYYLLTLHRPYNVDNEKTISNLLNKLSNLNEKIIFPVHPRTRNTINKFNIEIPKNILTIKPLGYIDFLNLEINSKKILTDSGGIQKEAYILKKPCITIRTETEWTETLEDGWNILVDPCDEDLVNKIIEFNPSRPQKEVFGCNVTEKMIEIINSII